METATDIMSQVAKFASDVKRGESRALSTSLTLSNPEYRPSLFDLCAPQTVFLRSGVNTLSTDPDSVILPTPTADPDGQRRQLPRRQFGAEALRLRR